MQILLGFFAILIALTNINCITVYQPLSGLHRPVIIDTQMSNFKNQRLIIQCVPEDLLDQRSADVLCRKVATLFRNQGAKVQTFATLNVYNDDEDTFEDNNNVNSSKNSESKNIPASDLTLQLRARMIHEENNKMLATFSCMFFTLIPAFTEYTFVQDITIHDSSGFLLVADSLKGRFVRYFGITTYLGNIILDWFREEPEKLTGKRINKDFSKDFYSQLSQLVFNAKMRRQVLLESASINSK